MLYKKRKTNTFTKGKLFLVQQAGIISFFLWEKYIIKHLYLLHYIVFAFKNQLKCAQNIWKIKSVNTEAQIALVQANSMDIYCRHLPFCLSLQLTTLSNTHTHTPYLNSSSSREFSPLDKVYMSWACSSHPDYRKEKEQSLLITWTPADPARDCLGYSSSSFCGNF